MSATPDPRPALQANAHTARRTGGVSRIVSAVVELDRFTRIQKSFSAGFYFSFDRAGDSVAGRELLLTMVIGHEFTTVLIDKPRPFSA